MNILKIVEFIKKSYNILNKIITWIDRRGDSHLIWGGIDEQKQRDVTTEIYLDWNQEHMITLTKKLNCYLTFWK